MYFRCLRESAEQILQEAREWGAELIVVGHHNGPATWFFGSVAEALVKGSSLPLLIVPSTGDSTPSPLGNRGG
jgi:nucleotide-binding universal stress UspA family protein